VAESDRVRGAEAEARQMTNKLANEDQRTALATELVCRIRPASARFTLRNGNREQALSFFGSESRWRLRQNFTLCRALPEDA
jgi:hypothetical protein